MALDRSHRIGNVGREKTKWHRSELGNSPCTKPNQIVEFCELHLLFRKVSAAVQWHNESFFFLFDDLWYSEKISNIFNISIKILHLTTVDIDLLSIWFPIFTNLWHRKCEKIYRLSTINDHRPLMAVKRCTNLSSFLLQNFPLLSLA